MQRKTQVGNGLWRECIILHPFAGRRGADIPASQILSSKEAWVLFLLSLSVVTAVTTAKQALVAALCLSSQGGYSLLPSQGRRTGMAEPSQMGEQTHSWHCSLHLDN